MFNFALLSLSFIYRQLLWYSCAFAKVLHLQKCSWGYPHPPEGTQQKQKELQSCSLWNKNHIQRKIDKMKRQRAMKEQDKTPEKQLNEVEIGNLPEKDSE